MKISRSWKLKLAIVEAYCFCEVLQCIWQLWEHSLLSYIHGTMYCSGGFCRTNFWEKIYVQKRPFFGRNLRPRFFELWPRCCRLAVLKHSLEPTGSPVVMSYDSSAGVNLSHHAWELRPLVRYWSREARPPSPNVSSLQSSDFSSTDSAAFDHELVNL